MQTKRFHYQLLLHFSLSLLCNLPQHFTGLSNTDLNQKPKQNNGGLTVDFSANSRMLGHPETNHIEVCDAFVLKLFNCRDCYGCCWDRTAEKKGRPVALGKAVCRATCPDIIAIFMQNVKLIIGFECRNTPERRETHKKGTNEVQTNEDVERTLRAS